MNECFDLQHNTKESKLYIFKNSNFRDHNGDPHSSYSHGIAACERPEMTKDRDGYYACTFLKISSEKENAVLSFYMRVHV